VVVALKTSMTTAMSGFVSETSFVT